MRIEIIKAKYISDLERKANYTLSKYKNEDILDIKYYVNGNNSMCSVMIIYKEDEASKIFGNKGTIHNGI